MKIENALNLRDKPFILLALRAKFRGLEPSISDYHRDLKRVFNQELCYSAVRKRLSNLEEKGFLKSDLIKEVVSNNLVDSKGEIKLRRFTKVFKKVYVVNDESRALKQFIKILKGLSRELFKKNLSQLFCNDDLLKSLV